MTSCILFSILIAVTCSPDILFTAGELDRFEALTKDAVIVGDAEGEMRNALVKAEKKIPIGPDPSDP